MHYGGFLKNAIFRFWRFLKKPANVWPNPPYVDDNNIRGLGWAGDRRRSRPFNKDSKK